MEHRADFEELLLKHQVAMYVCGHNHQYERSYPVYDMHVNKSFIDAAYPVHIVNGAAGDQEGVPILHTDPSYDIPGPDFRAKFVEGRGYGRVTATRTTLQWDFIESSRCRVADSFTLRRTS